MQCDIFYPGIKLIYSTLKKKNMNNYVPIILKKTLRHLSYSWSPNGPNCTLIKLFLITDKRKHCCTPRLYKLQRSDESPYWQYTWNQSVRHPGTRTLKKEHYGMLNKSVAVSLLLNCRLIHTVAKAWGGGDMDTFIQCLYIA